MGFFFFYMWEPLYSSTAPFFHTLFYWCSYSWKALNNMQHGTVIVERRETHEVSPKIAPAFCLGAFYCHWVSQSQHLPKAEEVEKGVPRCWSGGSVQSRTLERGSCPGWEGVRHMSGHSLSRYWAGAELAGGTARVIEEMTAKSRKLKLDDKGCVA